jgi:SOS-response transcriptional repressor LexA
VQTVGERIHKQRKARGLSGQTVATATGVSKGTISQWENDITKPKGDNLLKLAKVLRCSAEWLNSGKGDPSIEANAISVDPRDMGQQVPLISWVNAGEYIDSPDLFPVGEAEDWVPSPKNAGPHTFALKVRGDSMTSPNAGARSYPEGVLILIDPDKPVYNGCRVVARNGEEYTFKQYVEDAGARYLKPLNPQYPTLTLIGDEVICGVVIGSYLSE